MLGKRCEIIEVQPREVPEAVCASLLLGDSFCAESIPVGLKMLPPLQLRKPTAARTIDSVPLRMDAPLHIDLSSLLSLEAALTAIESNVATKQGRHVADMISDMETAAASLEDGGESSKHCKRDLECLETQIDAALLALRKSAGAGNLRPDVVHAAHRQLNTVLAMMPSIARMVHNLQELRKLDMMWLQATRAGHLSTDHMASLCAKAKDVSRKLDEAEARVDDIEGIVNRSTDFMRSAMEEFQAEIDDALQ